jgi:hypothetical protein
METAGGQVRRTLAELAAIRQLVERHYDPAIGWPLQQQPSVLTPDERSLLGAAADGTLPYTQLSKAPL